LILYVNGDSHSAGHGTKNPAGMTFNDIKYDYIGEAPHPDNLLYSYGSLLAKKTKFDLVCQALSGGSIERSIRTTKQFIYQTNRNVFVLIGFPSYEREEWFYNGAWYQVNASGHNNLPEELHNKYKEWIANYGPNIWSQRAQKLHSVIIDFHLWLLNHKIPHLFFNTEQCLDANKNHFDFKEHYLEPYNRNFIYSTWLKNNGYIPDSWSHFMEDGHQAWADFLEPHIQQILIK
jgi:hypothetical protein